MTFGRHGTFYLREGWLGKIFEGIDIKPDIFSLSDAPLILGVGKNMVTSLKFWALATKIAKPKGKNMEFTNIGKLILKHDKYIESEKTKWLLHYNLVSNIEHSTTWYWMFNEYNSPIINKNMYTENILKWLKIKNHGKDNYRLSGITKPEVSRKTLNKDIQCFINTYEKTEKKIDPDNNLFSPLSSLNLISKIENKYVINTINNEKLIPIEIFEYVLCNYILKSKTNSDEIQTRNFRELLDDPLSPGRVLRLSINSLYTLIEKLNNNSNIPEFLRSKSVGIDIIQLKCNEDIIEKLMLAIYGN